MSFSYTAEALAVAAGGRLSQGPAERVIQGVHYDSRQLQPGDLFVALVADRDGHDFIPGALAAGAGALLVSRAAPYASLEIVPSDIPVIEVSDTLKALGLLGLSWRRQQSACVIAITGSNGKTTTKEMLAQIMGQMGPTLATEGNYNNLIGVPMTLFGLDETHEYAVIEMGMNAPGEITALVEMAEPNVGTITSVAAAHLEGLGSIEGVAVAKGEMFGGLPESATAVVLVDEPWIVSQQQRHQGPVLSVSACEETKDVEIRASSIVSLGADGFRFQLHLPSGEIVMVNLPLIGRHQVSNAVVAAGVAWAAGASAEAIVKGLALVAPAGRRMRLSQNEAGVSLLDDCYNSNPTSCAAALRTLRDLSQGHRAIAVLGDMLEMGPESASHHAEIGALAAELKIDVLFGFGADMKAAVQAARDQGLDQAQHFTAHDALWEALAPSLNAQSWVLVKGSRGMRLEKISRQIVPEG